MERTIDPIIFFMRISVGWLVVMSAGSVQALLLEKA
jgi:hypothetical protein